MRILGTGIDYSTGDLLVDPLDEQAFGEAVQESLTRNAEELRRTMRASATATTYRGEVERERSVDLGDPKAAGWTFLVNGDDPQRSAIARALRPLAEHRGMEDPASPLAFSGEPEEDWNDWLQEHYFGPELEGKKRPHYILVAGGPDQVPFHFQALLDSAASVGRVDFDSVSDLDAYVEKVIRLEGASAPVAAREALFFAPDGDEATYFSRRYMADPLAQHVKASCRFPTSALLGDDASKERFLESARKRKPALVYTASHGLGAPQESLDVQRRVNGAICCQHQRGEPMPRWLLTADDVPVDEPFLEGSIFFQFACFGYGTPAESDFQHWLGGAGVTSNASTDFVAALPKKLLGHPRGPVGFVGHVDTAWLHGFDDPENPHLLERWHPRIAPYKKAIDILLKCQPTGLAMADMNKRFDLGNAVLTTTFDRIRRGRLTLTPELNERLSSAFILRSDAQNYMVFGDPAARLRIPAA